MSMFGKRHYEVVAGVIADVNARTENAFEVELVAEELCDMFIRDNEKFNGSKFLKACGMEEE